MDADSALTAGGIKGINLDNYFPNRRSYNSVVYFHKKFLKVAKEGKVTKVPKVTKDKEKPQKNKSKGKKKSSNKHDKAQQFNSEDIDEKKGIFQTFETGGLHPIFENTLKFAKNCVPLVIPTGKESSSAPLFYTIKTSRKHKKLSKKFHESSIEKDITYNKEKGHKLETDKKIKSKVRLGSCSARESFDPSSQNTLDDIHININQSSSFTESTELKYKREHSNIKATNDNSQKYFVTRSFDALATESLNGEGNKIKIHLMNDTDKTMLCETIKNPIINAIRDYLSQLSINNDTDLKTVQRTIKCNNQKLDEVLEKLAYLEKQVSNIQTEQTTTKPRKSPRVGSASKASKLEELGKDIFETKEDKLSEEEFSDEYNVPRRRVRKSGKSVVVALDEDFGKVDKKKETMGCGEEVPAAGLNASSSISQLGVKPDRPNRIPARFCWTDADRM